MNQYKSKIISITSLVLLGMSAIVYAGTRRLEVPVPGLKVVEAMQKGQGAVSPDAVLIGVNWARGKDFVPPMSDGSSFHVLEAKDEWTWFLTYVVKKTYSSGNTISEIEIIRIHSNGKVGGLAKART